LVCLLLTTGAAWGTIINDNSNAVISFDENGNGNYIDDSGLISKLQWGVGTPPMGNATLYYVLPFPVTEGDVVIYEPQIQLMVAEPVISDVLRFVNLPTAALSLVYVYSDSTRLEADELPALADAGIPAEFMDNLLTTDEQGNEFGWNGLYGYTPQLLAGAPSEPGSVVGTTVTYNFTSDVTVPEPATMCILGLGALTLIRRKITINKNN
jgi:hypothetical protein